MRSLVVLLLIGLLVLNVFVVRLLSATFFPEQDTGILIGQIIADQSISFTAMEKKLAQLQAIVQKDPAVASVAGFTGGRALNTANVFIELKPLAQRHLSATEVVNRLRPKLNAVSGARLFMQAQQDLHIGGRQSAAEYQYTMTSDDASALFKWVPKLVTELGKYRGQLDRRELGPAAERPAILREHQTARRRRAMASSRTRSTTCCMTHSASARCRRSTTR